MSKVYYIKDDQLCHGYTRPFNRSQGYARKRTNSNTSTITYRINFKDGYYVLITGADNIDGTFPVYTPSGSKMPGVTTQFSSSGLKKMGLYNELMRNSVITYPFNFK